jgi:hypothetical protein
VPLRHRNLLSGCRDPVPERLYKIDLLVDREIIEPWRRSGDYLGHEENSYDQEYIVNRKSKKADKYAPVVAINGSWNLFGFDLNSQMVIGPFFDWQNNDPTA